MCYNCGCGIADDDMGVGHAGAQPHGKSITTKTFEEAAKSQNLSVKKAMENTLELLKQELKQE